LIQGLKSQFHRRSAAFTACRRTLLLRVYFYGLFAISISSVGVKPMSCIA